MRHLRHYFEIMDILSEPYRNMFDRNICRYQFQKSKPTRGFLAMSGNIIRSFEKKNRTLETRFFQRLHEEFPQRFLKNIPGIHKVKAGSSSCRFTDSSNTSQRLLGESLLGFIKMVKIALKIFHTSSWGPEFLLRDL